MARSHTTKLDRNSYASIVGPYVAELNRLSGEAQARVIKYSVVALKRRLGMDTKKALRKNYGIAARSLDRRISVDSTDASVTVYGVSLRVPLNEFGGRFVRGSDGATAQISLDKGRKTYSSAFIIKGRKAIYARKIVRQGQGDLSRGARAGRFPLVRLTGPSVVDMVLGNGQVQKAGLAADEVQQIAEQIFSKEVDRLIKVELNRKNG